MATGIVLCQGDRTTCGGRIVVGSALGIAFGKPIAKEGDPVTCGKVKGFTEFGHLNSGNGDRQTSEPPRCFPLLYTPLCIKFPRSCLRGNCTGCDEEG